MEELKSGLENVYTELMKQAKEASKYSYSPYSNFAVGAACLYESGKTYKGSNIENVSYGLGLCAERNAISTAICSGETSQLTVIAVYSPNQKHCLPCGACLQWLKEMSVINNRNYDITVVLEDYDGLKSYKLSELLPYGFIIG